MYRRVIDSEWDFRTANTKEYTHCYYAYPAMMIPQVARKLISDFAPAGRLELLFDPYMGSGTSLVEASLRRIRSIGTDLNPLARLIAKVKTTHYNLTDILSEASNIELQLGLYSPENVCGKNFDHISNYKYWYSIDSLLKLSYINQLIDKLATPFDKEFFYLCLSETVREVSYTRNGEFKRYRMAEDKIATFNPDVFGLFLDKLHRNIEGLKLFNDICASSETAIYGFDTSVEIPDNLLKNDSVEVVVTSPPYGDSHTTVAYGQFSRWANEWFGFENAQTLDRMLMGGRKKSLC